MRFLDTPSATVAPIRPLLVAVFCAGLALNAPAWQNPEFETAAQRLDTLRRVGSDSKALAAERTALEFCLACGVGDGQAAAGRVAAIGYHHLPLEGPLPLDALRPEPIADLTATIDGLPDAGVNRMPSNRFRIVGRDVIRRRFGPGGLWMLPTDYALLLEHDPLLPDWVDRPAYLVVRVKTHWVRQNNKMVEKKYPRVVGGTLVQVLSDNAERQRGE